MSTHRYGAPIPAGSGKPAPFPVLHGRQIFNLCSLTTLARSPIEDLAAYATAGAVVELPGAIDFDSLTIASIVEASPVIWDADKPLIRRLIPFAHVPNANTFQVYLPDRDGGITLCMTRPKDFDSVFSEGGTVEYRREVDSMGAVAEDAAWLPRLLNSRGLPDKDAKLDIKAWPILPGASVRVYPHGRGNPYWGQNALHRDEEIAETMRTVMSGSNLLPVISGNVGNKAAVQSAFAEATNAIVFPGDIKLDRVISAAITQMLIGEDGLFTERWYSALKVVKLQDGGRPVEGHSALRMAVMMKYISKLQDFLKGIVTDLGGTVKFASINMLAAQDRAMLYPLYKQMLADGSIVQEDFDLLMQTLIGV